MSTWYIVAVLLLALALLAYRWKYSVLGWDSRIRWNLQWLLIAALLAAAAVAALEGVSRG